MNTPVPGRTENTELCKGEEEMKRGERAQWTSRGKRTWFREEGTREPREEDKPTTIT